MLVLSEGNSIHTQRWCESLAKSGVEVLLFTLRIARTDWFDGRKVSVFSAGLDVQGSARLWCKARYLCAVVKIWQAIKTFKPDIVHAHYASSYGLLGALAGFHPYVVSVWGSDVYEFPRANWLARQVIRFVFRKADYLLSTSHVMAREAARYTDKHFTITPFGVDLQRFSRVPGVAPEVWDRCADKGLCPLRGTKSRSPAAPLYCGNRLATRGFGAASPGARCGGSG